MSLRAVSNSLGGGSPGTFTTATATTQLLGPVVALRHWNAAVAKVRAGVQLGKAALIGDSTTTGTGAGSGGAGLTGARAKSYPTVLATLLQAYQVPAQANSFFGGAGQTSTYFSSGYDPRVIQAPGTGWQPNASSLGGGAFQNTTTTDPLQFTPVDAFDTMVIYYIQNTGFATWTVNVDGGATLATVNSAGTSSVQTSTVTTTLATHTINIARTGVGTSAYIIGIDTYDSATKKLSIWNMGQSGTKVADWVLAVNPWDKLNALGTVAPDLTIIDLGINDWTAGTDPTTFAANYQTLITKAQLSGDCILMVPVPSSTSSASTATQTIYADIIRGLAVTNTCALVDMIYPWGSYTISNGLGYMYDNLHPLPAGYADMARSVYNQLVW